MQTAAHRLRILAQSLQPLHVFESERAHDTIAFLGSARPRAEGLLGGC